MVDVLRRRRLEFRVVDGRIEVKRCDLCQKGNRDKVDNQWKLYLNQDGSYHCFRCGLHGSWFDFKKRLDAFELLPPGGAAGGPGAVGADGVAYYAGRGSGSGGQQQYQNQQYQQQSGSSKQKAVNLPNQEEVLEYPRALFDMQSEDAMFVRKYLTETRGISEQVLLRYGVGMMYSGFPVDTPSAAGGASGLVTPSPPLVQQQQQQQQQQQYPQQRRQQYKRAACITFPWMSRYEDLSAAEKQALADSGSRIPDSGWVVRRIKARALENKAWQRLFPRGGPWGFFGWNTVRAEHEEIVLTEGEFDAMAVNQATGMPAVSLPNGAHSLPVDLLPPLERFKTIYLWMDNDEAGIAGAEKFSKKLGQHRCLVVRPAESSQVLMGDWQGAETATTSPTEPGDENAEENGGEGADAAAEPGMAAEIPKDANDALLHQWDMSAMLNTARTPLQETVQRFGDMRNEIATIVSGEEDAVGAPVVSLPRFNNLLKGFRPGELIVFTGPTGAGKTTLLSQMTLDLVTQQVPMLWGSFEIKNARLMAKMLQQHCTHAAISQLAPAALQKLMDDFAELPLYCMNFHGGTEIDKVLDAMDYALYKNDVEHIVLDNLQFMMTNSGRSVIDRFELQDMAIEKFRRFATDRNVNVVLVIHPRKEDDSQPLGLSSVFGSAKATQEADAVIVLQSLRGRKFLDLKKNRFSGDVGSIPIAFSPLISRFYELDSQETSASVAMNANPYRGGGGGYRGGGPAGGGYAGGAPAGGGSAVGSNDQSSSSST